MKTSTIIRIILTAMLLVLIWCGNKWALYLAITGLTINAELQNYFNNKSIECMKLLKDLIDITVK